MVVTAFTPPTLAMRFPPELWPSSPTLRNVAAVLSRPMFVPWVIDSTVMAVVVTGLTVLTASMAGYAFAKLPFAGSRQLG